MDVKISGLDSYNSVKALGLTDLKKVCRSLDIDTNFRKHALVNIVCLQLGISTTSGVKKENVPPAQSPRTENCSLSPLQFKEFQALSPKYITTLKGWEKNLRLLPDYLDDTTVKMYLKNTRQISEDMARTYKISRPYQLKCFIRSLKMHQLPGHPTFIALQAQCNPSQSAQAEDVKALFIILDAISAQPYGGYCTCTVGYCQACGHMGAALFCVADLIASGQKLFPDDPSCTEVMAAWTDPKVRVLNRKNWKISQLENRSLSLFDAPGPSMGKLFWGKNLFSVPQPSR